MHTNGLRPFICEADASESKLKAQQRIAKRPCFTVLGGPRGPSPPAFAPTLRGKPWDEGRSPVTKNGTFSTYFCEVNRRKTWPEGGECNLPPPQRLP